MKPSVTFLLSFCIALSAFAPAVASEPSGQKGSVAYNEWLGREFVDTFANSRDSSAAATLAQRIVATDYIQHNPLAATAGPGRAGLLHFFPVVLQSFPDAHFTLLSVVANKDRVAAQWTFSGTFNGAPFVGVAPSGKAVQFDGIDIWIVKDGQLYEHWDQIDWTRFLVQAGAQSIPPVFRKISAPPGEMH